MYILELCSDTEIFQIFGTNNKNRLTGDAEVLSQFLELPVDSSDGAFAVVTYLKK